MGCDTKGYIKGINFSDLVNGLNTVIGKAEGTYWNAKLEIPTYTIMEGLYGFYSFDYDPEGVRTGFTVTLSENSEHRRMYAGIIDMPDPSADYVNPMVTENYGALSFSDWGHSKEIMSTILNYFKSQGYQVYIMENDCAWDTAQEM